MLINAVLPDGVNALRGLVLEQPREVERLKPIIDALQRHRFGRRSE